MTCVRSGFCCKQSICPYGKWDKELHQCEFLEGVAPGSYSCGKHDEIMELDPEQLVSPAFGAGCGSTLFNEDRDVVLKVLSATVVESA